ncbi:hypothetical protein [Serratia nevei]|uniref:hypothetical protein n=1 Tax=Serratia nevei TaxID=2703794 RepID=UPI00254C6DBD|nr:hypothetical protein [Serratia nevei]MDK5165565.1 hypothetical protein [Serratia nevei]
MGNCTEHIIHVNGDAEDLMAGLGKVLKGADEMKLMTSGDVVIVKLSHRDFREDIESSLIKTIQAWAREGMESRWFRYSNFPVFTSALDVFGLDGSRMPILRIDRFISNKGLAEIYAGVESGTEPPETLGKEFEEFVRFPEDYKEIEEIEEAFTVAELLMKHSVPPSDDHEANWIMALDALREYADVEWKKNVLDWLEAVCGELDE